MTTTKLLAAASLATALTFAAAAQAQPAPPSPPSAERPSIDHAQRLRAVLQLRPQQEAALQAFLAAMKPMDPDARRQAIEARRAEPKPAATPDRIARRQKMRAERLARVDARERATLAFYNQLDARQKAAFDALAPQFAPKGGRMKSGMRGHGRFGHRMGQRPDMPAPPAG